jgi:hypothetical protein
MVTDRIHHDRTFWGIRFPVRPPPFDQSIINIVQEYLEGSGHPVLKPCLQGLDLTAVLLTIVGKADRKFIEHTSSFLLHGN